MRKIILKIFYFYYEGFSKMTWGKNLWLIIIIKLFIMFFILKLFFFKDYLNTNFKTDKEKGNFIVNKLTE